MPTQIANPYANLELKIPKQYLDDFQTYTMTRATDDGTPKNMDRSPFDRYVDLWWAAIGVGVCEARITEISDSHKFSTGVVLNQEPWRIVQLELLAIGHYGSHAILNNPGQVIEIANGFAATGIPLIVEILAKKLVPIWDLSNFLQAKAKEKAA